MIGGAAMFVCLHINPKEMRLKDRRKPAALSLVRIEPPGSAPFFRLEVTQRRGCKELPWNEIEQMAGRLRTRMLFPAGIMPPPQPAARSAAQAQLEPGLRAFVPKRLPLLLSLQAARRVLQAATTPPRDLRVTVVDTKGVLCRNLEALVPLAGSLRVFTPDPKLYRAAAEQLQLRYGVALIISSSPGCFAQSHVVIADDLQLFTGREGGLIFTPDSEHTLSGCRVVRCGEPLLPPQHAQLCPPGIDPLLFACALYELCGLKEMERLQFSHFTFDAVSQTFTIDDLAGTLDNICAASTVSLALSGKA